MILFGVFFALNATNTDATWHVMEICSLTEDAPYYDCDISWIVAWSYEAESVIASDGEEYLGVSYRNLNPQKHAKMSVCTFFPIITDKKPEVCWDDWIMIGNAKYDSCYERNCITLLWHELKHLVCQCSWHKDLTPAYKIKLGT